MTSSSSGTVDRRTAFAVSTAYRRWRTRSATCAICPTQASSQVSIQRATSAIPISCRWRSSWSSLTTYRYWIVEYDVRFGGEWSKLFDDLSASSADLLGTTVQASAENPGWAHWHTLSTGTETVPAACRVKAFLPFGRISQQLLRACDARYRQNWSGHPEVLWPTIATVEGLRVEDIGGGGSFVPAERRGRYYRNTPHDWSLFPGTFVSRPCFLDRDLSGPESRFPDTLWHPVKETVCP